MNIEKAKAISIAEILAKLELKAVKESTTDATYSSPFRSERTPSFHVNKQDNVWFDHGAGIGGNAYELIVQVLKSQGYRYGADEVFRWIKNTNLQPDMPRARDIVTGKKSKWKLLDVMEIEDLALIRYLEHRGINVEIANQYVKEIYVKSVSSLTKLYALGFKNEDGGYELRNRHFKSCVSPKTITFIRADEAKPDSIMLFEGFMDFLTYATIKKNKLPCDVIVLNSIACIDHAYRYIRNYGYKTAFSWFDNDNAGELAKQRLDEFLAFEGGITHRPLNYLYKNHKDLNAWHMALHNLKPVPQ